MVKKNFREFQF